MLTALSDLERAFLRSVYHPACTDLKDIPRWGTWKEENNSYTLTIPIPGLSESDLQLSATEDSLTLSAEGRSRIPEGWSPVFQERPGYQIARTWRFHKKIEVEKVSASLKNGLLTLVVPFAAQETPRTINIQVL